MFFQKRAQGTIEYLIIIAIIIVVSLVVLVFVFGQTDSIDNVGRVTSDIELRRGIDGISVLDIVGSSDSNGLLILKNRNFERVRINSILVDGVAQDFDYSLPMNSEMGFFINDVVGCDGERENYNLEVIFTSQHGLSKKLDFGIVKVDCVVDLTPSERVVKSTCFFETVVCDNKNGLMWQQGDKANLAWQTIGDYVDETCETRNPSNEYPACEYCENLVLCKDGVFEEGGDCSNNGGILYDDWFLPSTEVYDNYLPFENRTAYFYESGKFDNSTNTFWTANTHTNSNQSIFILHFPYGWFDFASKSFSEGLSVRCVRLT